MSDAPDTDSPNVRRGRRGSRAHVEIAIDKNSDHNFWADLDLVVERGGVFVATYQALELGTVVDLLVTLPDAAEPVTIAGVVRWTRPHLDDSDGAAGVGIKFLDVSTAAHERFKRFASVREPIVFALDDAPLRRQPNAA
jgi:uncharacterized protein (TIGR02266 family)